MKINSKAIKKSINCNVVEKLIVILHGYGADGANFSEVANYFSTLIDNAVFICPDAPFPCDMGFGRQWFPLKDEIAYEDLREGLDLVGPIVCEYIEDLKKEYNCENVYLIGFSQGCMVSFEMLYHTKIAKIAACAGIFAASNSHIVSNDCEVLIAHSDDDKVVDYEYAKLAKQNLNSLNIKSEILTLHNIGHSVSIEGWNACMEFFKKD